MINSDLLPDYTDAQLLKIYRAALANGYAGQTRSFDGRTVTFPSTDQIKSTIEWLEARLTASSDMGDAGIILAEFR